jgi:hypothetical protein
MGISAAVPVVSGVASQIKYGGTTPINEAPTKQVPSDQLRKKLPGFKTMLMENDKITLPRFQMFAWTWISILVYLVVLFSHIDLKLSELWNISIPELNILFVALMGLSQGTYIATKVASADVFSINEIRPKKIQLQTENNLITILGSNFGDKGTVWIEYYPPLTDREKQDITDYHEEYNDEYVYDPRRIEEQFEPTIIKRENNRILASLDNMKDSLKIQNYVCRVEKDGLLTYASSDAIFEVTALPITKKNADIKLSCSKSEITVNGPSEISADVTKMDGSYADNVEVSFIISNTEIAEFKDNINKKLTDSSGLSNVTIKGKKIGDITVKATATLNSEIVEDSCDIKVIG